MKTQQETSNFQQAQQRDPMKNHPTDTLTLTSTRMTTDLLLFRGLSAHVSHVQ